MTSLSSNKVLSLSFSLRLLFLLTQQLHSKGKVTLTLVTFKFIQNSNVIFKYKMQHVSNTSRCYSLL